MNSWNRLAAVGKSKVARCRDGESISKGICNQRMLTRAATWNELLLASGVFLPIGFLSRHICFSSASYTWPSSILPRSLTMNTKCRLPINYN